MRISLKVLAVILIISSCQVKETTRETILDQISHVEDSIHYQIDSLPRLCNELGMKKQYVDIGDCKLYCETEGKGIPIILINGGPGGTHHCFHPWFKQAADFSKIIYYDQRGCGQSDYIKGDNGYSFRQAIEDLDKLRQKLGIDKWIVCGYSYGGALAQYYTVKYPENVLGMVLIGSSPMFHDNKISGTRQQGYISEEEKSKIKGVKNLYKEGKLNLSQLLVNLKLNGDWKRQNFLKPSKEEITRVALYEWVHDNDFNSTMSSSHRKYDFKNIFNHCPIPTLLCEGKWDLTWSKDKAYILKENHPNSQLIIFENSGHTVFHDEPKLFFSKLENFVASLKPILVEKMTEWYKYTNEIIRAQEIFIENETHFFSIIENESLEKGLLFYKNMKSENKKIFTEKSLNYLGYTYLNKRDFNTALELFKLNADEYPDSGNVYDSLGEAYLKIGNKEKAVECYKKSIELNPDNKSATKILKEITMPNKS